MRSSYRAELSTPVADGYAEWQALATTPRRPNYFKLPSLNLQRTAVTKGDVGKRDLVHEARSTAGSQTARDMRKIALARDSIVHSLRVRMESGARTAR
jgi:hypothetical protein